MKYSQEEFDMWVRLMTEVERLKDMVADTQAELSPFDYQTGKYERMLRTLGVCQTYLGHICTAKRSVPPRTAPKPVPLAGSFEELL